MCCEDIFAELEWEAFGVFGIGVAYEGQILMIMSDGFGEPAFFE